jgi:hypothetical protein
MTESSSASNYFGLIDNTEATQVELHGYEVTMSGKLVLPELHPQPQDEIEQTGKGIG